MESYKQNPKLCSLKVALISFLTYLLVLSPVKAQMNGQLSCTSSMISTFTPCLNYLTGSTPDGSMPSSNCCDALKSVMRSSMDCACLMVTASVPLPLIVNRTLALGLPRICKAAGVPVKCEAMSSPLPSPGPVQFGAPPVVPPPSSAFSPQGPVQSAAPPVVPPPSSTFSPQGSVQSGAPSVVPSPSSAFSPQGPVQSGAPPAVPPPSSGFSPQASKSTGVTPTSEPTAASDPSPVAAPSSVEVEAPSRTPKVRPVLTPSASSASMIPSPTIIWTLFLMGLMLFKL